MKGSEKAQAQGLLFLKGNEGIKAKARLVFAKNPESRAQAVLLDLVFGVFVFVLLFAFLYSQWQASLSTALREQGFEELHARGFQAVDSLVSSKGQPSNWHLLSQSDINVLGIARKRNVVDEARLSRFLSLDYEFARQKLALSSFDFFFHISNSQGVDFNFGLLPDSNIAVFSFRRIVDYKGVESIVDFTVFKKA